MFKKIYCAIVGCDNRVFARLANREYCVCARCKERSCVLNEAISVHSAIDVDWMLGNTEKPLYIPTGDGSYGEKQYFVLQDKTRRREDSTLGRASTGGVFTATHDELQIELSDANDTLKIFIYTRDGKVMVDKFFV